MVDLPTPGWPRMNTPGLVTRPASQPYEGVEADDLAPEHVPADRDTERGCAGPGDERVQAAQLGGGALVLHAGGDVGGAAGAGSAPPHAGARVDGLVVEAAHRMLQGLRSGAVGQRRRRGAQAGVGQRCRRGAVGEGQRPKRPAGAVLRDGPCRGARRGWREGGRWRGPVDLGEEGALVQQRVGGLRGVGEQVDGGVDAGQVVGEQVGGVELVGAENAVAAGWSG